MRYSLGSRVVLTSEARPVQGKSSHSLPAGTVGTVVNNTQALPLVDFGDQHPVYIAPQMLELLDLPDGAPQPDDGNQITVGELLNLVVALYVENRRLRAYCAPTLGRS
ncbi:MAG: hypothetical protein HY866_02205 [Chloroflexi bacterium]|nr:hypothetical protein [Chloroflexota bacterium]